MTQTSSQESSLLARVASTATTQRTDSSLHSGGAEVSETDEGAAGQERNQERAGGFCSPESDC